MHSTAQHSMTPFVQTSVVGETVKIYVSGDFNFAVFSEFRKSYQHYPSDRIFIVDLYHTVTVSSGAIGQLLILLEHVGQKKDRLHIIGCSPTLMHTFEVMKIDSLMTISGRTGE